MTIPRAILAALIGLSLAYGLSQWEHSQSNNPQEVREDAWR